MTTTGRTGVVLRHVREGLGLQQWQVGTLGNRSRNWVAEVESGRMDGDPAVLAQIGRKVRDGRLIAQAARRVTGGAFVAPVLDGPAVDLHRSSVAAKLVEELDEAVGPARRLLGLLIRPVRSWSQAERSEIGPLMEQCLDAERAVQYIAIAVARELDVDVVEFYAAHDRKLTARGYTREFDGGDAA